MTLETSLDEVFKKIGRNVVLFQYLEHLLKYLVAHSSISGIESEIISQEKKRRTTINKQTMGRLIGQYIEIFNPESQEVPVAPENLKEDFISFNYHIERDDSTFYDKKKESLDKLRKDRNKLIHHLLPQFNPNSIESCVQIGKKLDAQRDNLVRQIDILKQEMDGWIATGNQTS